MFWRRSGPRLQLEVVSRMKDHRPGEEQQTVFPNFEFGEDSQAIRYELGMEGKYSELAAVAASRSGLGMNCIFMSVVE